MSLRTVLADAFTMLRERPVLFLPRLAMTLVWSVFWLVLVRGLLDPVFFLQHPERVLILLGFFLVFAPVQVLVYNLYFIAVRQHSDGDIDLWTAAREGFWKLPQGIGAFLVMGMLVGVTSLPGTALIVLGVYQARLLLVGVGALLIAAAVIVVAVVFFFAPAAAVIGEESFLTNLRHGLHASREGRRDVFLITVGSFVLLIGTNAVQGALETAGIVGFFIGRLVAAVIGVYVLIVNPDLFLDVIEE